MGDRKKEDSKVYSNIAYIDFKRILNILLKKPLENLNQDKQKAYRMISDYSKLFKEGMLEITCNSEVINYWGKEYPSKKFILTSRNGTDNTRNNETGKASNFIRKLDSMLRVFYLDPKNKDICKKELKANIFLESIIKDNKYHKYSIALFTKGN